MYCTNPIAQAQALLRCCCLRIARFIQNCANYRDYLLIFYLRGVVFGFLRSLLNNVLSYKSARFFAILPFGATLTDF